MAPHKPMGLHQLKKTCQKWGTVTHPENNSPSCWTGLRSLRAQHRPSEFENTMTHTVYTWILFGLFQTWHGTLREDFQIQNRKYKTPLTTKKYTLLPQSSWTVISFPLILCTTEQSLFQTFQNWQSLPWRSHPLVKAGLWKAGKTQKCRNKLEHEQRSGARRMGGRKTRKQNRTNKNLKSKNPKPTNEQKEKREPHSFQS